MIQVRVEIPRSATLRLARLVDGKAIAQAEAQAINRTAANVAKVGQKEVAKEMGIPVSRIAKRGRQKNFRGSNRYGGLNIVRRANRRHLDATISGRGKPFNVRRFKGQMVRKGVARHEAWGDQRTIGPVWALKNGAIVVRSGNSFRGVFGPGITHVMQYSRIERLMQQEALERFPGHFRSAVRFYLRGGRGR